jgi:hypothetical protein
MVHQAQAEEGISVHHQLPVPRADTGGSWPWHPDTANGLVVRDGDASSAAFTPSDGPGFPSTPTGRLRALHGSTSMPRGRGRKAVRHSQPAS